MPASPGVLVLEEAVQILARVLLGHDTVEQVRPVVAGGEQPRVLEVQPLGDVAAGRIVGGRRQRQQRRFRKALLEDAERLVVAAEIVAPLRDAMRLVDREQRDPAAPQQIEAMRHRQPLRRHVQQIELAAHYRAFDRGRLACRQSGIQRGRPHAGLAQRVDLVLHQRDQRRHDTPNPGRNSAGS